MTQKITLCGNKKTIAFTLALFVVFAALAALFPDSGDDWAWGSSIGIDRLKNGFDNYNGRWAGNLLVIALTSSKLLDVLLTAAMLVCICRLPGLFAEDQNLPAYGLGLLLLLIMPKQMWVQSVVWTAGLTNYIPPILLNFTYFLLIRNIFAEETPTYRTGTAVWCGVIGFAGVLFMENVTLYSLFIALAVMVFVRIKHKKFCLPHITYLLGCVVGSVVMFSNSAYRAIAAGTDTYRSTAADQGLFETITQHSHTIFLQFFQNNIPLLAVLTLFCILLFVAYAKNGGKPFQKRAAVLCLIVNLLMLATILVRSLNPAWKFMPEHGRSNLLTIYLFAAVAVTYCLSVVAIVVLCITDKAYMWKMLLLLGSVPVLVAPLLVVNPIGPRCFFPPYFMLMAACVMLFVYIGKTLPLGSPTERSAGAVSVVAAAAILVSLFSIYIPIHKYDVKRNDYAKKQAEMGLDKVVVSRLPNSDYVWVGNPDTDVWSERYKLFHGIDPGVELELVDCAAFDAWVNDFDKVEKKK